MRPPVATSKISQAGASQPALPFFFGAQEKLRAADIRPYVGASRRRGRRPRRPVQKRAQNTAALRRIRFAFRACHCEPVRTLVWQSVPPLFRSPPPAVFRTAVFPTCIIEFCRRCVYIIFLPNAVVPDRKIEKRPDRHAVAVEAPRIARNYVNKFCEQIVPFRLVLAWPPC